MKINKFTSIVASLMLAGAFTSLSACPIDVDIHPTSCPNPMNLKSGGLVPAALVGSGSFDVLNVDTEHPNGIQMYGKDASNKSVVVKAVKPKDVVGAFSKDHLDCGDALSCTEEESDGFKDLEVKFPMQGYYITVFNDAGEAVEEYQPGVADILKGYAVGGPVSNGCVPI